MSTPQEVWLTPQGVHIRWDDGHEGFYPHRYLRGQCPCAACVEEMSGRRLLSPEDVPPDVEVLDWMAVGRYALRFLFSDAHDTGIYPFDLLRELCRCPQCAPAN